MFSPALFAPDDETDFPYDGEHIEMESEVREYDLDDDEELLDEPEPDRVAGSEAPLTPSITVEVISMEDIQAPPEVVANPAATTPEPEAPAPSEAPAEPAAPASAVPAGAAPALAPWP